MESYRGWRIKENATFPRLMGLVPSKPPIQLMSYSHNTVWESSTMTATCEHGCDIAVCLSEGHQCSCGLYSLKSATKLMETYGNMDVYGIIFNHGAVHEGEGGFRSEKATIRVLYTADIELQKKLQVAYPDVTIMFPPEEFIKKTPEERDWTSAWQRAYQKKMKRLQAIKTSVEVSKLVYPGGPDAEKERLMALLKGANREQIIKFAKQYASTDEWAQRNWQGHIEHRTRKAKAGDMVFEANEDSHPYVFIGSTRPNEHQSMRWLFDRNGVLVKRPNIRKWDEEESMLEARKRAIEEWE